MNFQDFMNEWVGRSVDYDHVFRFQCVDLILQYLYEGYGINGAYGNAIDFWANPNPKVLARFHKVSGSDALTGDIVIFNGLPGNPYGHIGIATGNLNATALEVLEQNGQTGDGSGQAGDSIRTRYISRDRVAGLLRPNAEAPAGPPYTVEEIDPRMVKVRPGMHKWNLNYDNFQSMSDNAVDTANDNTIFTAVELVHHHNGYSYYRAEGDVNGWNVLDCDDYTPPAPKPYVPPAAPLPVAMATKITLVTDVPYYETANNAKNHYKEAGKLKAGTYYQFPSDNGMWNLSSSNMKDLQHWVNPSDNVAPVAVPEPVTTTEFETWKANYKSFNQNRKPVKYVMLQDYTAKDFGGNAPGRTIRKYTEIPIYGTFNPPDGKLYGRLRLATDVEWKYWYGIPLDMNIVELEQEIYNPESDTMSRQATKNLTFRDYEILALDKIESIFKNIDGILPRKKKGKK